MTDGRLGRLFRRVVDQLDCLMALARLRILWTGYNHRMVARVPEGRAAHGRTRRELGHTLVTVTQGCSCHVLSLRVSAGAEIRSEYDG
jgi:hypothetical protein